MLVTLISCASPTTNSSSTSSEQQSPETVTEEAITVTDSTNTEIVLDKIPERILCLDPVCLDILAELGIEPAGILQTMADWVQEPHMFGEQGKKFSQIASIGELESNLEQIVQLKPDLIIGLPIHKKTREALKGVIPFYMLAMPETYSEAIANLKTVGQLTGKNVEAEAAAKKFLDKLATYKAKSPQNQTFLLIHSPAGNLAIFTDKALNCRFLNQVANCLSPEYNSNLVEIHGGVSFSLERLTKLEPDVIFISSYDVDNYGEFANYSDSPLWQELTAVKNGRVYGANPAKIMGLGTRGLGLLLDQTMPKIYPDVFSE
ncbi:MAG: ABC transporter substrate-binding protein [Okeania sp. SIO1H6]|nr:MULTISPECIES: ABC transporter substrate-binding protein [unclassified Okeania]NEP05893.1 ABC transporter substrate-binding protein [Okeania sp. SIO4D6]NEP40226.1 ABC transporter substrate-binding protein [Okeania sp. SIO2H7]NES75567.1 ABC transporter substrate-binding protein [Okeania sp. SIO1H4]NET17004.1 ABC transporter substrate-binding protein [Okeania sp. SIO1H6]NEP75438.1 ABC transporter substrate-binding protein [Okeania sp. SIO2G5]